MHLCFQHSACAESLHFQFQFIQMVDEPTMELSTFREQALRPGVQLAFDGGKQLLLSHLDGLKVLQSREYLIECSLEITRTLGQAQRF